MTGVVEEVHYVGCEYGRARWVSYWSAEKFINVSTREKYGKKINAERGGSGWGRRERNR